MSMDYLKVYLLEYREMFIKGRKIWQNVEHNNKSMGG